MANEVDIIIGLLQNEFLHIKEVTAVYLYGSFARGDFSMRHSDFDVLIFLKKNKVHRIEEKINGKIIPIGLKQGIKIHAEYVGKSIKEEDASLLRKIIEEGFPIYAISSFVVDNKKLGLRQFFIYSYSLKNSLKKSHFSKILHGRKSWYYKKNKKVIKEYVGIIDHVSIIGLGKGAIMVTKERQKDVLRLFQEYEVEFVLKRIVYG